MESYKIYVDKKFVESFYKYDKFKAAVKFFREKFPGAVVEANVKIDF